MSSSEVYRTLPRRPGHEDVRLQVKGNGRPSSPRRYHAGCGCGWTSGEGTATWAGHEAVKHATGLTDMELLDRVAAARKRPTGWARPTRETTEYVFECIGKLLRGAADVR